MAALTPAQLLVEFTEQTLTSLAHLIVVQADGSKHISIEDLRDHLLAAVQDTNLVQAILDTAWYTPISNAEAALALLAASPHAHTPELVGLENVANVAKEDLPISTLQQTALDAKVNADVTASPSLTTVIPPEW